MNNKPFISVFLPVRNSASYLEKCLDSISKQKFRDFEVIAIDDFSTDESYQILKKWAKKDKRFRIYKNKKHYGVAVCLNRAMRRAKGNFISFMHSKDVIDRMRFQLQIEYLLSNPKTVAVGTQSVYINTKDKKKGESSFPTEHELISKNLLPGGSMQFESALINRSLFPKDLLKFSITSKNFILREQFLKLANYGQLANLPQFLHFKRVVENKADSKLKALPNLVKLWVKSTALEEYETPSLRSLLPGFGQTN